MKGYYERTKKKKPVDRAGALIYGRFPRRGLPFRNELLVEHEPVRGKREHPNALALLDPIGLDRCSASRSHESQGHLPAVDLDGIKF